MADRMDDVAAAQTGSRPASAMRRNNSYTVQPERPESSASSLTQNTPSTTGLSVSGASQIGYLTPRAGSGKGPSLLQERLRERKVESARATSLNGGGGSSIDVRGVQSSPIKGSGAKEERRPSSGGVTQMGKGMGVKQMEDQVSTLHKQNFDLKLELYHRRQRQETLEAKLEEQEKLLKEFAEMREVNDQLLAELERRDQALDEAVGVIVNLEDKVERLMKEREMVRSVEDNPYHAPSNVSSGFPRVPDEAERKQLVRMPSFLSEHDEGTEVLRSLYLPPGHGYGDGSLAKLAEEESMGEPNSPRLSLLSESSFLSVYGDKLDLNENVKESPKRRRSSVENWVGDRPDLSVTPRRASPDLLRRKQFVSINDVLESPLQRLEKLKHNLERQNRQERPHSVNTKRRSRSDVKNVVTDKKSFENTHTLPPTPDTLSTNTLTRFKASDDTLAVRGSFLDNKSSFTPTLNNSFHNSMIVRPRSAGETITSRREGHGWDTETQTDLTETGSTTSTYSPSNAYEAPVKRVRTPDLFNFSASNHRNDWGRDLMFNTNQHDEVLDLPPLHNRRVERARRASLVEAQHSKSDDTVMRFEGFDSVNTHHTDRRSTVFPLDEHSPRPDPPDRRSSILAMQKVRKASNVPCSPTPSKHITFEVQPPAAAPTSRKARLANKIFRRNSSSANDVQLEITNSGSQVKNQPEPQPNSAMILPRQRPLTSINYSSNGNHQSDNSLPPSVPAHRHTESAVFEDGDRATPPPIRRSRTHANTVVPMRQRARPSSAGTDAMRVKRISGFGGDGHFDADKASHERAADDKDKKGGHQRKGSIGVDIGVARGLGALLGHSGSTTHGTVGMMEDAEKGGDVAEGKRKWLGLRRA